MIPSPDGLRVEHSPGLDSDGGADSNSDRFSRARFGHFNSPAACMITKYGFEIHDHLKEVLRQTQGSFIKGQSIVFGGFFSNGMDNPMNASFGSIATENVTIGMAKICGFPLAKYQSGGLKKLNYYIGSEHVQSKGHCEDQFLIHWDALWNTPIMQELVLAKATTDVDAGQEPSLYVSLKLSKSPCYACADKLGKFLQTEWRLPEAAGGGKVKVILRIKFVALYEGEDKDIPLMDDEGNQLKKTVKVRGGGTKEKNAYDQKGSMTRNTGRMLILQTLGAKLNYWEPSVVAQTKKPTSKGFVHELHNHMRDQHFISDDTAKADQEEAVALANKSSMTIENSLKRKRETVDNLLASGGHTKVPLTEQKEKEFANKRVKITPIKVPEKEQYRAGAWPAEVKKDPTADRPFSGGKKVVLTSIKKIADLQAAEINEALQAFFPA